MLRRDAPLATGSATVWAIGGGTTGVARVERHPECVAVTWSTWWRVPHVHELVKHARRSDAKKPSASTPTPHISIRVPAKVDALLVDDAGSTRDVSTCNDLLKVLSDQEMNWTFVRIEIEEGTLVWTARTQLDGWNGKTLGVVTLPDAPSYTGELIRASATEEIAALDAEIVSSFR